MASTFDHFALLSSAGSAHGICCGFCEVFSFALLNGFDDLNPLFAMVDGWFLLVHGQFLKTQVYRLAMCATIN